MKRANQSLPGALIIAGQALTGCESSAIGPGEDGPGALVSLSIGTVGAAGSAALSPAFDVVQTDPAGNELVLTRVALVLREIEFERQFDECPADSSRPDDDICEKFETDPMLFDLPLDGGVEQVKEDVFVGEGTYDEIEFDVHKVGDDPEDLAFLTEHPDFEDISIRVEGTFQRPGGDPEPFVYINDFNEEQELPIVPPLEIMAGGETINVTMLLDVTTWFVGSGLIDPRSANKGGPNENLVRDNIRDSIEGWDAFEDSDRDGRR